MTHELELLLSKRYAAPQSWIDSNSKVGFRTSTLGSDSLDRLCPKPAPLRFSWNSVATFLRNSVHPEPLVLRRVTRYWGT